MKQKEYVYMNNMGEFKVFEINKYTPREWFIEWGNKDWIAWFYLSEL